MDFVHLLSVYHDRVNLTLTRLINSLPFQSSSLIKAMQYGTLLGGKRLRPFLVYAIGEMFKVDLVSLDAPAAAIECIHAYSLIHDDLPSMDNDILRRGKPTCHMQYGENIAILAGDALQTLAFSILADQPMINITTDSRVAMISELAQASGAAGMCGGQALDLSIVGENINLEELELIYRYKTGALVRAAVRLGAIAAGDKLNRAILLLLDTYANAIGLAFQVQDDIIDNKKDTNEQISSKNTYPILIGLDQARIKTKLLYQEAISVLKILSEQAYNTNILQMLANFIIERDK